MKEKKGKIISLVLSLSMIASTFAALPLSARADGEETGGETNTPIASYTAEDVTTPYTGTSMALTDRSITLLDETVKEVKALGYIAGGIGGVTTTNEGSGVASLDVTVEDAGTYDVTTTFLGTSNRRTDIQVGETVYEFGYDSENYPDGWEVITIEASSKQAFTHTFEEVELAAGDNTILIGTNTATDYAPDFVGLDIYEILPAENGIVYKDNEVKITYDAEKAAKLIIAKYYDNGTLRSVSFEDVSLTDGTVIVPLDLEGEAAKLMVWDSISETAITPIVEACRVDGTTVSAQTPTPTVPAEPTPTVSIEPTPTTEPTPVPTPRPTRTPIPEDALYAQTYEDVADKAALDAMWISGSYQDGVTLETDNTKYAKFTDAAQNTRSAYSDFAVDLTEKTEYVVEFDLALKKSNKEDVQFAIRSGSIPALNSGITADCIFKITMLGTTNNCIINDISTTTVTLPDQGWCHYKIYVDTARNLETVTITSDETGEVLLDKAIVPTIGVNNRITGAYFLSGRYQSAMNLDNIVVREATEDDEFGEMQEETLSKVEFTSALGGIINQPEDGVPVHKPIGIKATGIYGGDLTDKVSVEWSTTGLESEDGYTSLTKEEGTEPGTIGEAPDGISAFFNVRHGVSNYYGAVNAKITYLEKTMTISTPFAITAASDSGTNIAPAAGYPESMNSYSDDLVGYSITATGIDYRDVVLNNWSIYGSNATRTLTLKQDADETKYLQFNINGGSGSSVGVYQLADQSSQYIVDMKVRFSNAMAFGHYYNTPNNTDGNPSWTCDFAGDALTVGTQSITGLNTTDWFRILVSADESSGTSWVKVYKADGTLLGTIEEPLSATYTEVQKYFCFQGTYPVDLASFRVYYPMADEMTINAEPETVQVPEDETVGISELTATLKDSDGHNMTGKVEWTLDEEYAGVSVVSDGTQAAKLSVTKEAGPGTVTVVATYGSTRAEKQISLSTTGNAMVFKAPTSSLTIPFAGEDNVTATYVAEVKNKAGEIIPGVTPTLSMVDASGGSVTGLRGVTFDPATGLLTVAPGAASKIVYIKAEAIVTTAGEDETLTSRVKVNIHGLSFAFGSDAPADISDTQVTSADSYTDKIGYGFADVSKITTAAANVTSAAEYRFKAKVPNGNYRVDVVTTSTSMTSEVVEGITATAGMPKTGTNFIVAVCDGVLDLTFLENSTLSKLTITQDTAKTERDKPMLYAIGDSTTSSDTPGFSWGNCVASKLVSVPDVLSGFANHGKAGDDSVVYYNANRVENILLSICPGDYVTVNMGINSKATGEPAAYYTMLDQYYVQGIIQRGGIPVIVTATPQGPVGTCEGNYKNGVFTCNRGTGAHNGDLRKIAQKYNLNIIELGYWGDDYFNGLTDADVTAYNTENGTSFASVIDMVKSWYPDHNHYTKELGVTIAEYIMDCVVEIKGGSTDFNWDNNPHKTEQ